MSGFIGIVSAAGPPVDPALLIALSKSLVFRGPDGLSTHFDDMAGFGLSLLQNKSGYPQKNSIPKLDEHTWIVSDARLDSRTEVIARFEPDEQRPLNTASDPELILHCYRRWGDSCLAGLTGDFSFALWDGTRKRLLCARDPLGVKPFFFTLTSGGFICSNTLECVRAHPDVSGSLDDLALADFLLFGAMQDPSATAFAAIKRLPPGHSLVYEKGDLQIRRYWQPDWGEPLKYRHPNDTVEHFREVLQQAVADRVTSPQTAVLMSGGLDSTAVAATARGTQSHIKAFTVVYDRLIPDEERYYSGEAAAFLGVPVEYLAADNYKLYEDAEDLERPTPEPVDAPLAGIFFDHLRQVRNFSNVALSGQGGDAIFAIPAGLGIQMLGGRQLRQLTWGAWHYLRLRRRIPPLGFRGSLKRVFSGPARPVPSDYPAWLNPELESRLGLRERWLLHQKQGEPQAAPGVLLNPFWPALFEGYDPGVTGIPVEVRHPLLDLRLVRLCMSLSPVPWWIDKTLLRVAMQGRLPASICFRPKAPVVVDPVAARLPGSGWLNTWEPSRRLHEFVIRDRIPSLCANDVAQSWNLRPLALNRWLGRVHGGVA
jgi:asparagine synthase (glutamine-hydrolysing)